MARVLGKAGRYVSQQAEKKYRQMLTVTLFGLGVTGWISGLMFGVYFNRQNWSLITLVNVLALAIALLLRSWAFRRIDELAKERREFLRGEAGEISLAWKLESLPDGFYVVNDLKTECGNLDSVVIGPTGVFALDAKNWRGIVAADGNGELMLNGRNDRAHIKPFVGRVMGIRERVKALAPEVESFFQSVFVFTAARVEAPWSSTGNVHCIRDEQLHDYIVERKGGKRLSTKEVKTVARAFAALARMDPDFLKHERAEAKDAAATEPVAQNTAPALS
jgi:hypothetical protein